MNGAFCVSGQVKPSPLIARIFTDQDSKNCGPQAPSPAQKKQKIFVAQALLPVLACGVYTFAAFHDLSRLITPSRAPLLREGSAPPLPLVHESLNPLSC
jgi:hypothetical protein